MSKLVTVFGGSGFVGRYVVRRLAKLGWRVRVAVRRPNEALFLKPLGGVGQVELMLCNVRDDRSVQRALAGADAAVNCIGVLQSIGKNSFDAVQHEGAGRIAQIAKDCGVSKLVHISAIGANLSSDSEYLQSKAQGEAAIKEAFSDAVILRPSVIFGSDDSFFNRFGDMTRFGPILPIFGGASKFQPVFVDDVAHAVERAVATNVEPGIYELGGPDVETLTELMKRMLKVIERRSTVINMPSLIAKPIAAIGDFVQWVTRGLIPSPLSRDQLKALAHDNVVSDNAKGLNELGIKATSMSSILPNYLWRFRPNGQYAAIQNSAKNLRS